MRSLKSNNQLILLLAVFVIASCGLIYELVAGTLASYVLGDSVTQFSTIIGVYLFSMGIGSFLSKYIGQHLLSWFIKIELLVGLIGGFSAVILFYVFPLAASFRIILYALVSVTGILVGLEIPLLMRILQGKVVFKELVSRVFTFDYIGALLASLIFPLVFVPHLGLIKTALFFGMMNTFVGLYLSVRFKPELKNHRALTTAAISIILLQLVAFVYAERIMEQAETNSFADNIVYAKSTPYQRIVITRNKRETRLFLNGNLQFSSADEYRYHEALVHPALSSITRREQVLILGGGDGMAAREVLKYPDVKRITLVDLDPAMTRLFTTQERFSELNNHSLSNPKVTVQNADAFTWLRGSATCFDAIIIDFPDPSNYSIGKLYSNSFYQTLFRRLKPDGIAVIQSTSPFVAPNSFWCVDTTLRSCGFSTKPYHNLVPSFGDWGYILAMKDTAKGWFLQLPDHLRFADRQSVEQMFYFPPDMHPTKKITVNKLNNQSLVSYFEEEWSHYLDS
ncbi:polyamine aminopropyltransferase [Niabella beijingensis]|uniref:polyamine aminopropyltransferase n=1 Tax=Niabella beijingensis TaxID=2872700 RepID=UPI001CBC017A|nr:polyamine aminopropyltransferase [Niabella beijingensis]MBZ4187367.1 polyamine aminopropyltransferase [Niabella beijingensis]